jgi:hypothetical protein
LNYHLNRGEKVRANWARQAERKVLHDAEYKEMTEGNLTRDPDFAIRKRSADELLASKVYANLFSPD